VQRIRGWCDPSRLEKGVNMATGAEKPLPSEEKTNSRTEHEAEGDNPGVGGMPAEKPPSEEKTNSRTSHEAEGDNPGVGGMPANR